MLMPTASSALRRMLELWFERQEIKPLVVAEFEDRALDEGLRRSQCRHLHLTHGSRG